MEVKKPNTIKTVWQFLLMKKTAVMLVVGICIVVGLLVGYLATGASTVAKKPDYKTVLPKGKTITELGGWKRVSPPKKDPVFAYADTIDGVAISVSQQPLPQSFKDDSEGQTAELAKKYNATDKVDAGGLTLYVGTSAKGPQSAILTKNNLLILIKSQSKINDTSWARYAQSLN